MDERPFVPDTENAPPSINPFQLQSIESRNYEMFGELARGGQGRVISARDRRLRRNVAIKELLGTDEHARRRFEREALITARLQHPGIVNIHEAGRWADGKPFYVMRLVVGKPLHQVIAHTPTFAGRIQLLHHVIDIAEALAYAHSQGVIHRDLKPANVLVGSFGETVVVDWGLAKDLRSEETGSSEADESSDSSLAPTMDLGSGTDLAAPPAGRRSQGVWSGDSPSSDHDLTVVGGVLGTPAYMSPEQARGEPADERSDVYSIGAILYHVLTGEPAYEGASSKTVLNDVLSHPPTPMENRQSGIPTELNAIVKKAMARDRDARYPTAKELVQELRRFEAGQLVGAHSYTSLELFLRWVNRNRGAVMVGGAALVLLALLGAVSVQRILRERDRAETARARADERADEITLVQARSRVDRNPVHALAWLKELSPNSKHWPAARLLAEEARDAGVHWVLSGHEGRVWDAAVSPNGKLIASAGQDHTIRVWNLDTRSSLWLTGHTDLVKEVQFSPDGTLIASGGQDGSVRLWNVETGQGRVLTGHRDFVRSLAFFSDGTHLASSSWDGTARIWNVRTGESRVLSGDQGRIEQVAVSPDGRRLATAGGDGTVLLWDIATGESRVVAAQDSQMDHVAFSPDGRLLAASGQGDTLNVYSLENGRGEAFPGDPSITRMVFSPDGSSLATSSFNGSVRLWDPATKESRALSGSQGEVLDLAYAPDGHRLATAGVDASIIVWDLKTERSQVLNGHEDWVLHVEFSPDGRRLISCGLDQTVRVWDLAPAEEPVISIPGREVMGVAFAPEGGSLASYASGTIYICDLKTRASRELSGQEGVVRSIAYSPDGTLLASAGGDRKIRLWNLAGGEMRELTGHEGGVEFVAFSPDGSSLASASIDKTVRLWSVATDGCQVWGGHTAKVAWLAFSPDGRSLASGSSDNTVRVWNTATGESRELSGHQGWIWRVLFSPDGRSLASSSEDGTVRFWDMATGQARVLSGHQGWARALAFSPHGRYVASGGADFTVRIWDVATGEGRTLRGHSGEVTEIAFSPDGASLASASSDGTVRIWDVATGVYRVIRGHEGVVTGVVISADGRFLVSSSLDGSVRLWRDDLPRDAQGLREWLDAATNAVVGSDNDVGYPWEKSVIE